MTLCHLDVGTMPDSGFALGIDVSGFQPLGAIDWEAAAHDGVGWAIARVSCGAQVDPAGVAHIRAMRDAQLSVGAYHFVNTKPGQRQVDMFLGQLRKAELGAGDIAPILDLEWIPGVENGGVPSDKAGYCQIVSALIDACSVEYGGIMIYSSMGFWASVGSPKRWAGPDVEWWCPWYPKRPNGRLSETDARKHTWPRRPGDLWPAAWQFDALEKPWCKCGEVDHNIARQLPFIKAD